jgi:hypothetical protein
VTAHTLSMCTTPYGNEIRMIKSGRNGTTDYMSSRRQIDPYPKFSALYVVHLKSYNHNIFAFFWKKVPLILISYLDAANV